jgi:uncharacterized protein (DUF2267 family)
VRIKLYTLTSKILSALPGNSGGIPPMRAKHFPSACRRKPVLEGLGSLFQNGRQFDGYKVNRLKKIMDNTEAAASYSPEEKSVIFFRHVKRDLGIRSTRKVITLVGQVLNHLRSGMSLQQAKGFLNKMPGIFQLLFISSWKGAETRKEEYVHLDELVDRIYSDDRSSEKSFGSEVEAMNAVVVILKKLDRYLDFFSQDVLGRPMAEELRQIHLEGAPE